MRFNLAIRALAYKLICKAQTLIPKPREKLRARHRAWPRGINEDPFAAFTEWASEADDEAYRSL